MIRVVAPLTLICAFFLGFGLALMERSVVLGAAMALPNSLMVLNALFFLALERLTRPRGAS